MTAPHTNSGPDRKRHLSVSVPPTTPRAGDAPLSRESASSSASQNWEAVIGASDDARQAEGASYARPLLDSVTSDRRRPLFSKRSEAHEAKARSRNRSNASAGAQSGWKARSQFLSPASLHRSETRPARSPVQPTGRQVTFCGSAA